MNILILGAGQVGSELSEILAEGHDVTLIDTDQEKLQKISDHHDLRTICGNGCFLFHKKKKTLVYKREKKRICILFFSFFVIYGFSAG